LDFEKAGLERLCTKTKKNCFICAEILPTIFYLLPFEAVIYCQLMKNVKLPSFKAVLYLVFVQSRVTAQMMRLPQSEKPARQANYLHACRQSKVK
jgi:hypothetical protein